MSSGAWWRDLSDDELRARLMAADIGGLLVVDVFVEDRDSPEIDVAIGEALL